MILDKIVEHKIKEVEELKQQRNSLKERLAADKISLLAEIKKASPSKGLIQPDFNPAAQLEAYEQAGAAGISILTDHKFFQGSSQILKEMRKLTELPILRKEFIIDPLQIYESFFLGADVILLIAAILDDRQLESFLALSRELNLEAVVEVHSQEELSRVLKTKAEIIGINNRDLNDFSVDLKTTADLNAELEKLGQRDNHYLIAESGIKTKADIDFLREIGVDGVLIGETLMRAESPAAKVKELGLI
ncbi:indole-3-glycerol phosphate synthase [Halanaerobium saccharolyticum]|uniref:Indole-3-glycerol phosphate synthase n=1 Tax=Halanaerobium saccharolyticum TaxID=43595 RepID=A0A4R7Z7X7_9FIRM|nr:indole-3-glycerol phosphate synthase TrpC [Halanaerobium saccharolyticum]RAK11897.1 indole-3-glycerol phosphate synthase [Halanaerobium saccharolyticum]TDW07738.1 indole-3-glycerol phosphate synthase [Halanaerobium saccharolyticum]TDX64659.1 indole-3-glycerol phosphate synthase [Halanaerobium saccharolyticum]